MARISLAASPALLRRGRLRTTLRTTTIAIRVAVLLLLPVLLYEAWVYIPIVLQRASFPFDDNMWNDQTAILQLWRLDHGGKLYNPTQWADSFDYGPMSLWISAAVRALLHLPFSIVSFRFISMTLAALSLVPLVAYTHLLLRRFGVGEGNRVPYWVALSGTLLVGITTLTRNVTFDGLHPDDILFLFTISGLLVYAYVADGKLPSRALWGLLALSVITVLTKLNSVAIFPILIFGLAYARTIPRRLAMTLIGTYVPLVVIVLAVLPPDMRAWSVAIPLAQPYELDRYYQFVSLLIYLKPYLGGIIVAGVLGLFQLAVRDRKRTLAIDGAVIVAIAVTTLAAYFKRFGIWNNVTLLAYVCIPYAMILLASLVQPRTSARISIGVKLATAVAVLAIVGGNIWPGGRPAPQAVDYQRMSDARAVAQEACSKHQSMFVTIFPSLFLNCDDVQYGLLISWGELASAFPGYFAGPTTLDGDPHKHFFEWLNYAHMPYPPRPWLVNYHLWRSVPVAFGYGWDVYALDATLEIWERNKNT